MKRTSNISPLIEICLRSIAMWPDSIYPNLHLSIYMTVIVMFQYHQYAYIFTHLAQNDLLDIVDSIGVTIANTLSFIKVSVLWWNRRLFCNILLEIKRDWQECISNSYSFIMMKVADLSYRCANVLIGLHSVAGFSMVIGVYALHAMKNINGTSRELPIKMLFSFEVSKSPVFECLLIGQFFYEISLATIVGMVNALIATLVLHVGGQIDIMRQIIAEISTNNDMPLTIFKSLICRHQKIITLSDNIEKVFTIISLMQILWNTLIICFCCFLIIVSKNDKDMTTLSRALLPGIAKTLEVFVFCYAGEFLSAKSKSIADAVYESFWYNISPSDSRVLLFIIIRSQKRLTITAGKITDLTLETFTNVMKTCGSYLSVLYAMY